MSWTVEFLIAAIVILAYFVAPTTLLWGWIRWFSKPKTRTIPSILSLIGFLFATASALLGIGFLFYVFAITDSSFMLRDCYVPLDGE